VPSSALAREARIGGLIRETKVLTEEQIRDLLDPAKLTGLDESRHLE
jgi:hypothetical protein